MSDAALVRNVPEGRTLENVVQRRIISEPLSQLIEVASGAASGTP